jgi:signal transduction histidine kinase
MDRPAASRTDVDQRELAERLRWLLRLRWLIVPVFVALDLATDLLTNRRAPWTALVVGAVLLLANSVYSVLLARKALLPALVRWARIESGVVVALPVAVVVLDGDPTSPLRYGVLLGVVGAAAILPRTGEIGVVATCAVAALIVGDAVGAGFDPSLIGPATVARWATDAGVIGSVAAIASYLHATRERTANRLRAATELLERARGEWEAAFDSLHDLVFVTDEGGRVVRANRAFAKILGVRPHELAGRRIAEVLAGHPPRWWSAEGDAIVEVEDPILDAVFEITSVRLPHRTVRIARDVGEQRRLHARLVQADKLAAVGVLATGVAHEINNPTAFVTSNLTELRRYLAAYETTIAEMTELGMAAGQADRVHALLSRPEVAFARREATSAICDSLEGMDRVREIVTNLRSLARRDQAGEPAAPVELSEIVQAVVRTAAAHLRSAAARVEVAGPAWVLGHRGELVDVVLNLVVNAVQAREEGRPNQIRIAVFRDGPSAVLRVSDTGRGIAPSHLKRLFEPFFTTKAPGEGTGLGLSLARKIVLAHGGAIDVASEAGGGSTFTVRLPALEASHVATGAPLRRASDVA